MSTRNYNQNCPIAKGMDVIGERWTLLILRELLGGPRRYGDLRGEMPGIATNLLADRLRELEDAGIVDRTELPPPIARTVYTLTELGWQKIPPILSAVALFGADLLEPSNSGPVSPLNGFLAGFLLAFDRVDARALAATYRVDIDGRRFDFAVRDGHLSGAWGEPAVTVTAGAADLVTARFGSAAAERKAALRRVSFEGEPPAIDELCNAFHLTADPGAFVGGGHAQAWAQY